MKCGVNVSVIKAFILLSVFYFFCTEVVEGGDIRGQWNLDVVRGDKIESFLFFVCFIRALHICCGDLSTFVL